MMASVKELLVDSLRELVEAELKKFKWHLQKDYECISKSEMENADWLKTVDRMVACFTPEEAVKITVGILKKMQQNHLAEELANKYKQRSDAFSQGNMKTSAPVATDSNMGFIQHGVTNPTRNTMLAEVVEKLKKTKHPADCDAGAGDVQCDVCTGRKYKAVKSCLMCQNSFCQNHLQQHESLFKGKGHNLTDATGRLQEMICQKHEKILEVFCRTDQKCICVLCTITEHKNHDTVPAAERRTEKQKQLKEIQRWIQQKIQQKEKDLQQLRVALESHKCSAQTAVEDSERVFTELICSIERCRTEIERQIRDQEKAAVSRAEGRLELLEQEINDLRRRDAELEELSHTQDHIQFLQSLQSLSAPPKSTDTPNIPFISLSSFDGMRESVRQLRDKLEYFCKEELKKISDRVTFTNIVPRTRNDFLQYSHQLTLDPNTVNEYLCLSEKNRVITGTDTVQSYPDHPDRFDKYLQLLCRESVCGRCYWEIEWNGDVDISVSYKSISRKGRGNECVFGNNDQSWSLICSPSRYTFIHNKIKTALPVKPISSRIGVFVDHTAGTLSFYSVSDTMSLIHTVQTTFTQPLYPGFWVGYKSSVKLC